MTVYSTKLHVKEMQINFIKLLPGEGTQWILTHLSMLIVHVDVKIPEERIKVKDIVRCGDPSQYCKINLQFEYIGPTEHCPVNRDITDVLAFLVSNIYLDTCDELSMFKTTAAHLAKIAALQFKVQFDKYPQLLKQVLDTPLNPKIAAQDKIINAV